MIRYLDKNKGTITKYKYVMGIIWDIKNKINLLG